MTEFIAFFVKNSSARTIEVHEIVEATDLSAGELARRIIDRTSQLHELFPIDKYDVYWVGYDSMEAMVSANSAFDLDSANLIPWTPAVLPSAK